MDDHFADCEVLLLDREGRTMLCSVSVWHGREHAQRELARYAPLPYARYEIWRGSELIISSDKDAESSSVLSFRASRSGSIAEAAASQLDAKISEQV